MFIAGYYCPRSAQTAVTDKCEEGFYCLSGQFQTSDNLCPAGFYCPLGSSIYRQCPPGTFTNLTGSIIL